MRVALVTSEFVTETGFDGGLANYVYRLALSLLQLGHEPVIIVSSEKDETIVKDQLVIHRVLVWSNGDWLNPNKWIARIDKLSRGKYNMFLKLLWQSYKLNNKVKKLHKLSPFDIIHYAHLGGMGFLRMRNVSCVARISSSTRLCQRYGGYGHDDEQIKQQEWIEFATLKRMGGIFGPSKIIADLIEAEINKPVKIIESPYLLDVDTMDASLYQQHLRGKTYLLFFGTICLIKGVGVIAEIIYDILHQHQDISFVFVGKELSAPNGQPMMTHVKEKACAYQNRVLHFDKMRHERLYPIIQNALAVVLPSRIDNFPNTCIEAMAHKRVVIGTKGNGFEQLIIDSKNGFLVGIDQPEELLNTIEQVLSLSDTERQEIGEQASQRVEALRPEIVVQELVEFYQDVLNVFYEGSVK